MSTADATECMNLAGGVENVGPVCGQEHGLAHSLPQNGKAIEGKLVYQDIGRDTVKVGLGIY